MRLIMYMPCVFCILFLNKSQQNAGKFADELGVSQDTVYRITRLKKKLPLKMMHFLSEIATNSEVSCAPHAGAAARWN